MGKAFRIALGGVVAALGIVLMACTGLFPYATLALPALAGFLTVPVVVELGKRWALLVYAVVGAVSVFLTPDLSAALFFLLFFGYYPIVKSLIEQLGKLPLEWAIKIAVANAALTALYFAARFFFSLGEVEAVFFGHDVTWALWLAANAVFVLYDLALTRLIGEYLRRVRPHLEKFGRR